MCDGTFFTFLRLINKETGGSGMKKILMVFCLAMSLILLSGCVGYTVAANNPTTVYALVFNEAESVLSVSPEIPEGYTITPLTNEQSRAMFYRLNLTPTANALVRSDGSKVSITAHYAPMDLVMGFGDLHFNNSFAQYEGTPVTSDVDGISVTAFSADIGHSSGVFLQATFRLNNMPYNVSLWNTDVSEGKERLTELVSMIIIKGLDLTLLVSPPLPPDLHGSDIASEWATEGIRRAHSLGLIPFRLFAYPTFTNYTYPATRAEFTALAVALYEVTTGRTISGRKEFNDTNDINVQKMGYLGVVTGVGNGNFAPNDTITREQAAVMLSRLATTMGQPLPPFLRGLHPFSADMDTISSWAFESVLKIYEAGIMTGVGNMRFDPQGTFTREQSIITMLRLFDRYYANAPTNDVPVILPTYITIRGEKFRTDLTELILDNVPVDGHYVIGNALRNEDIVPLRYLTNLTVLSLRGNHISDLAPLSSLTNLTYLNLSRNQISDIIPLSALTNLEYLDIRLNMISDLTPLTNLTNLTLLNLYGNHINDVSPLRGLTNLTHLGLWINEISDISPLAGLTNLTRLNLSSNRIQDLTPLSNLTNLTELWLGDNRIRNISPLSELMNLTELRLYRNQIADWLPVAHVDYVVGRPE